MARAPVHLFVSGRRAPHLVDPSPISQRPEPALLARLRKLGGIPAAVLREADLMALFLPILRADLAVNDSETPAAPPLACPITVMGGLADEMATLDELDAWRVHTTAAFERETFSGGHFFIQTARAEFLGSLARSSRRPQRAWASASSISRPRLTQRSRGTASPATCESFRMKWNERRSWSKEAWEARQCTWISAI